MLFPPSYLLNKWGVKPNAIVHVGGHLAEESFEYSLVWPEAFTIWVEAQQSNCLEMRSKLPANLNSVIHGAAWSVRNLTKDLIITNNSESSSLFKLKLHAEIYPEVKVTRFEKVNTILLSDILKENSKIDFMNLDIQGAELQALLGAHNEIENIKWIYCEVNKRELYEGCPLVGEIDRYLSSFGFLRVETRWISGAHWGDALYVNTHQIRHLKSKFLIAKCRQSYWQLNRDTKFFLKKYF